MKRISDASTRKKMGDPTGVKAPPGRTSVAFVLEILERQVRHASRIIDGVLDMTRNAQGKPAGAACRSYLTVLSELQ